MFYGINGTRNLPEVSGQMEGAGVAVTVMLEEIMDIECRYVIE
jgi:hypothetical protein